MVDDERELDRLRGAGQSHQLSGDEKRRDKFQVTDVWSSGDHSLLDGNEFVSIGPLLSVCGGVCLLFRPGLFADPGVPKFSRSRMSRSGSVSPCGSCTSRLVGLRVSGGW